MGVVLVIVIATVLAKVIVNADVIVIFENSVVMVDVN